MESIRLKTETEIADEQAGFRQGRGTRDHHESKNTDAQGTRASATTLYVVRGLQEGVRLLSLVISSELWVTMMDMGYPLHLIDLLAKLYRKQLANVKVAGHCQNGFQLRKESNTVVSFLRTCSTF